MKRFLLCVFGFIVVFVIGAGVISGTTEEAVTQYQLSTHILDVNLGRPAAGVPIILFKLAPDGENWNKIAENITDANGRIGNFLPDDTPNDGVYKLRFETRDYFSQQGTETIYPVVEVVFEIKGDAHYHIPITMSANGYGTYRGN